MKHTLLLVIGSALSVSGFAQASPQATEVVVPSAQAPAFVVNVTSRTVEAVNYEHRGGATHVDLAGTALLPSANGKVKVRSKRGTMEVEAEFDNLQSPTIFGGEYLTYVLWAISPEGKADNLGEVLIGGNGRSKLTATTDFQAFALIVTAEPYFAVQEPSDVVVLENVVSADTRGTSEAVHAKYELMDRGGYIPTGYKFDPIVLSANLPLEFYEARNALRIAQSEGAERYADASYRHAAQLMNSVDAYAVGNHGDRRQLIAAARETVQTAESAREIAVKQIDKDRRADERQASVDAQVQSQAKADEAVRQRRQAELATSNAQAQMAANDTASTAAISAAQADAEQSRKAAWQAQADSQASSDAQVQSQAQADEAIRQKDQAQSDAANAQADLVANQATSAAAVNTAQADAEQSRLMAQQAQQSEHQADTEKAAMRAQLSEQLNKVFLTRDSARGLIVSMSDVLFDTGEYSLKPDAREKLAKVAGILIAYPGLNIEVGGYTDNVGGNEMNQKLSESRAGAVRDYLVEEGVASESVTAKGFGNTFPVASNDNSAGRQENQRVEMVVSGDAIGNPINTTTGSLR
ncbi:MAG TPA: OmpA family protein [Terracidiphilus sp.]|nr:OmpA family protein [Terracidiphilus sp.]